MGIKYPLEAILKSKELKEEGNKIFISKAYREHGIAINLNIVACWLKLNEFELAKCKCDLVMKLD